MKKLMYRLEELMEIGGTKKDIALLVIGGVSLILSLINSRLHFLPLPFDIAWVAIILCGIPIIMEAIQEPVVKAACVPVGTVQHSPD